MCRQLCHGAGLNIGGQTGSIPICCSARKSISARSSMAFRHVQYAPHPVHESPARCFPAGSFACMDGNMPARITRAVEGERNRLPGKPSSSPAKSSAVSGHGGLKRPPALADRRLRRSPAHNADKLRLHTKGAATLTSPSITASTTPATGS